MYPTTNVAKHAQDHSAQKRVNTVEITQCTFIMHAPHMACVPKGGEQLSSTIKKLLQ
jgi:hypothetical protein